MEPNQISKKIFIVDDDKFLLDMYTFKFKEKGFEVIQAFGSIDALNKLKGGIVPDVILLDIVMPGMDGIELLAIIRKENLVPNAAVIMLTNENSQEQIQKAKTFGIKGYIIKAVNTPTDIVAQVSEIANLSNK